jgi:hypothetical protein
MTADAAVVAEIVARAVAPLQTAVADLSTKLQAAESRLSTLVSIAARLDAVDGRVHEIAVKELGPLRERVAVVETRPPVPGPPGKDGRDGLSVEDLALAYDGPTRNLSVTLGTGDRTKAATVTVAGVPLHRGVWAAGDRYALGDMVTWAGSQWHCQAAEASTKPGESSEWLLMVKRGRDGRDGKDRT